ncbi:MAG TPA: circularly permuted type 2 ATP-grasp protein [Pyrinomonadaceae bacterium]
MRDRAIAEYHDWLAADGDLTPEFFARLRDGMSAARLLYGDRQIGVSLRPHLIARARYDALTRVAESVASACEKLCGLMLARREMLDRVGLTGAERRLALVEPGYGSPAVTTRLDAFLAGGRIKFVEYNAENPSSLPDQPGLNQILFEVPALARLAARYRLRQPEPVPALLDSLLKTFREWSGKARRAPNIAILDWADLPTRHEFVLLRNYFVARGVPAVVCTPEELEYDGRQLRRGDFRIDLVYKRLIIHEFLARADATHPLWRAYEDGTVCVVNPFRCKVLHKKAAFELLTGDACARLLTAAERAAVRDCVPWTRRVSERRTRDAAGRTVDLMEHVRRNREALVLKPNDDYGGHGVCLGLAVTDAEWERMIGVALANDYVVQEAVELATEEFPVFDERRWALQPMYVDTNPFLFRGRMEGALVRLSQSPVVNVTSGGGETGLFVVEGEV